MHYHSAFYTAILGLSVLALSAPTHQGTNLLSRHTAPVSSSLDNVRREEDGVFVADGFKKRDEDDSSEVNEEDDGVFVADGFKKRDDDTSEASEEDDGVFVADGFKKRDDDDDNDVAADKEDNGVFVADGF